ncbi:MAG: carbonic anhydrase [Candidatus Eisenbacteria bacterium]|nr:carbonic anhydrase [Candidatus Eisenbacteria bacterium]
MPEIARFIEGFGRFRRRYFTGDEHVYKALCEGQAPSTMIVACCDSRVDPAIVLDAHPGDFFVVRNIANLVPPHEQGGGLHGVSAALEFGVRVLGVRHIVVMGHEKCGGIRALLDGTEGEFLPRWMSMATAARAGTLHEGAHLPVEARERALNVAALRLSLRNLLSFPWIRAAVEARRLDLHAWYFDLTLGELLGVPAETGEPVVLSGAGAGSA